MILDILAIVTVIFGILAILSEKTLMISENLAFFHIFFIAIFLVLMPFCKNSKIKKILVALIFVIIFFAISILVSRYNAHNFLSGTLLTEIHAILGIAILVYVGFYMARFFRKKEAKKE